MIQSYTWGVYLAKDGARGIDLLVKGTCCESLTTQDQFWKLSADEIDSTKLFSVTRTL